MGGGCPGPQGQREQKAEMLQLCTWLWLGEGTQMAGSAHWEADFPMPCQAAPQAWGCPPGSLRPEGREMDWGTYQSTSRPRCGRTRSRACMGANAPSATAALL